MTISIFSASRIIAVSTSLSCFGFVPIATAVSRKHNHNHLTHNIRRHPSLRRQHRALQEEAKENFVCQGPPDGCQNGLWNQDDCACDCIAPYSRDSVGDCTLPLGDSNANPWEDCTAGKDCPWWMDEDPDAEHCSTGNTVRI